MRRAAPRSRSPVGELGDQQPRPVALQQGRRQQQLLALLRREVSAADADGEIEAGRDDALAEAPFVGDPADQLAQPLAGASVPGHDPAEDQIVAHRERGEVASGVEEVDGIRRGRGELRREQLARLQELLDHRRLQVDEAIARRREIEREPEQQAPPLAGELQLERAVAGPQALPIERQVLRTNSG